ncbi:hypothetical protein Tco_0072067 [Tanacetum coccineum]
MAEMFGLLKELTSSRTPKKVLVREEARHSITKNVNAIFIIKMENEKGVVKFTDGTNEIAYKMPHKIEQYNSLSDFEKEHTKSVYLRNEEDIRRDVEYVMSIILGFYKECLELGPEYLTGLEDEGGFT